jgi:hypothetical protein
MTQHLKDKDALQLSSACNSLDLVKRSLLVARCRTRSKISSLVTLAFALSLSSGLAVSRLGTVSSLCNTSNRSRDFGSREVVHTEVQRVDAAGIVVCVITSVTGSSCVVEVTGRKGGCLVGKRWVTTNGSDLASEFRGNLLVESLSSIASRVLVLLESGNLGVHGLDGCARNGSKTDLAGVALQSTVDESSGHAVDITGCLGVGESLVSSSLLKAVCRLLDLFLGFE